MQQFNILKCVTVIFTTENGKLLTRFKGKNKHNFMCVSMDINTGYMRESVM